MKKQKKEVKGLPIKLFSPLCSKVRQRTKKAPITVEGYLSIGGKLEVTATPEDWEGLECFCLEGLDLEMEDPKRKGHFYERIEHLGWEFYINFVVPALGKLGPKPLTGYQFVVGLIKIDSALLYNYLKDWGKKSLEEYPEGLKKLIEHAKRDGYGDYIRGKSQSFSPLALTQYLIGEKYSKEIKKYSLAITSGSGDLDSDSENFYQNYIQKGRKLLPPKNLNLGLFSSKTLR